MEDDQLQRLWQKGPAATPIIHQKEQLMQSLQDQVQAQEKQLQGRNQREMAAAAVVGLGFGAAVLIAENPMMKWGAVLLLVYALMVPLILQYARRRRPLVRPAQPAIDYLRTGKAYLQYERRLARRVLYWYLLPPYVGLACFWAGMDMPLSIYVLFMAGLTALYTYIFLQNQKAVRQEFDPLIAQLETSLQEWDAPASS